MGGTGTAINTTGAAPGGAGELETGVGLMGYRSGHSQLEGDPNRYAAKTNAGDA